MKNDSVQSRTIEWLRFFCAALVVLLHAFGPSYASYEKGVYDFIRILFSQGICRVAVPVFFFISGYLFYFKPQEWNIHVWISKLKKRIHTLLIPYFIWNLIAIALSLVILLKNSVFRGGGTPDIASWFESIGGFSAFWNSLSGKWPIDGPLWFIRNLMILVVLSPIIYYYIKKTGIVGLYILSVLYILRWWIKTPGFECSGFVFFTLGAYFSINQFDFALFFKKHLLLTSCFAIPLLLGMAFTYGNNTTVYLYLHCTFTLFGSASIIGLVSFLIQNNKIHVSLLLSNSSFFIYAAHNIMLLLFVMQKMNRIFPNTSQIALLIKYFAAPSITIFILLGCYYLMNRWTPKLLAFLTGGR